MATRRHAAQRAALAAACRRLAAAGLAPATSGNGSLRAGDELVISPGGCELADLDSDDVIVTDLEGNVLEGEGEPTSELATHRILYAMGPQVGAIVHTHAPYATAVGCVIDELPVVHYAMLAFGGAVRVAPYATFGSDELAAGVHAALRDRRAALMANHGAITYAADVGTATELMLTLEWACMVYWRAAALGAPRTLDDDELRAAALELERRDRPRP
jgi:L-fuculose-phosphate aldolase